MSVIKNSWTNVATTKTAMVGLQKVAASSTVRDMVEKAEKQFEATTRGWAEIFIEPTARNHDFYSVKVFIGPFQDLWKVTTYIHNESSSSMVSEKMWTLEKKEDAFELFRIAVYRIASVCDYISNKGLHTVVGPKMIWHALSDLEGDIDEPSSGNGIVYLKQDHNVDKNAGNLLRNFPWLRPEEASALFPGHKMDRSSNIDRDEGIHGVARYEMRDGQMVVVRPANAGEIFRKEIEEDKDHSAGFGNRKPKTPRKKNANQEVVIRRGVHGDMAFKGKELAEVEKANKKNT
jgi:hypothetical protein